MSEPQTGSWAERMSSRADAMAQDLGIPSRDLVTAEATRQLALAAAAANTLAMIRDAWNALREAENRALATHDRQVASSRDVFAGAVRGALDAWEAARDALAGDDDDDQED